MRLDKITLDRMEDNESLTCEVVGNTLVLQRTDLVRVLDFSVKYTLLSRTKTDYRLRVQGNPIVIMQCANTMEDTEVSLTIDEHVCITTNQLNDQTEELAYEMTQNFIQMNAVLIEILALILPLRVVKGEIKAVSGDGWQIIDPDEVDANEQSPFANLSQKLSE